MINLGFERDAWLVMGRLVSASTTDGLFSVDANRDIPSRTQAGSCTLLVGMMAHVSTARQYAAVGLGVAEVERRRDVVDPHGSPGYDVASVCVPDLGFQLGIRQDWWIVGLG
jgi:hypothetical protein